MISEAKTFKGLLQSMIQQAKKSKVIVNPTDLSYILEELLIKYKELEEKPFRNKIDIIDGWKSQGSLEIYKGFDKDFIIVQHIKDKKTGIIDKHEKTIKKEDVNRIARFINTWKVGESKKCYDFAQVCGFADWKSLWKERKIYFEKYYFPCKILEALKIIEYSGRGKITRLI